MPAPLTPLLGLLSVAALAATGLALWWRERVRNASRNDDAERTLLDAEQSLDALLLDRADGAAIWSGRTLQLATGIAEPLGHLDDPSPADIAEALADETSRPGLADALQILQTDGEAFEMSVRAPSGTERKLIGRTLGARALLTIVEQTNGRRLMTVSEDRLISAESTQARLAESFEHAPLITWRRDDQGHPVWANRAYIEAVEARDLTEVIDRRLELVSGKEEEAIRDLAARARTLGKPQTERAATVIDGSRRVLEFREVPVKNGTLGYATDVTAQVGAADALHKQIEANEHTLDRLHRGVAVFSKDLQLSYFNDAIAQLWELSPSWLQNHPNLREVLNALRDSNKVPQTRNFATWRADMLDRYAKISERHDTHWHLPGGGAFHVLAQPHPLGGLLLVFEDVTDFFELKRDMATVSAVQRAAFSRLREGILVLGLDGRRRLSNPAFDQLWGLDEEVLKDAHLREIAALCTNLFDDDDVWTDMIEHVSGAGEARRPWNRRLQRKDGLVLRLSTTILPDGATMFAFTDITDSMNKERALREQNEKLEELSDLKSAFLESIHEASQELNIPLSTIMGFTEILEQEIFGTLNERQREYVEGVCTASADLRQIVSGITDLAMIQADDFPFRIERIPLQSVLEATLRFIERTASDTTRLRLDCPPDIGELPVDAPRFREIVHNLIGAVRAEAGDEVTIEIGARRDEDALLLWVGTGSAVLSGETRMVFEADPQGSQLLQRNMLSTTLVRQFVERQGGWVTIETCMGATREAIVCHFLTDETTVRTAVRRGRDGSRNATPEQGAGGVTRV